MYIRPNLTFSSVSLVRPKEKMPIRNVRRGHIFCSSVFADEEVPTGGQPTRGSYNISREVSVSRNGLMRPILMWCSLMDLVLYVSTYVVNGSYVRFFAEEKTQRRRAVYKSRRKNTNFSTATSSKIPRSVWTMCLIVRRESVRKTRLICPFVTQSFASNQWCAWFETVFFSLSFFIKLD